MRRILSIALLVVLIAIMSTTVVNATTNSDLASKLYEIGSKYGMTSADKVRIERYLSDYPVTDEQANAIVTKANAAANVMESAGKTDISQLSPEDLKELKSIANDAASIVDVKLAFKSGSVEVSKDGKVIDTVTVKDGKLAYTGNEVNVVLVVSSIAVIALAIAFVARKKIANA